MARPLLSLFLLLAFAAVATAESCPSSTCTTGGAGNVDCCKHNFAANEWCSWPNTPVSFRLVGKCEQDGKTYDVLNRSNSQGPPNAFDPCRCPSPSGGGATKPAAPSSAFTVVGGYDIRGNDIPSNGSPYTRICTPPGGYKGLTGYAAYDQMCKDTPGCVAATTERSSSGCAYMKKAGSSKSDLVPNQAWMVITSKIPPAPPCMFASVGEACTTLPYPLVSQTICGCGGSNNACVNGVCQSSGYPLSGR